MSTHTTLAGDAVRAMSGRFITWRWAMAGFTQLIFYGGV